MHPPDWGQKKPPRREHRRGKFLISDQIPFGASGDEMTTTAEETAELAAIEALAEGIIDAANQSPGGAAVKPKDPMAADPIGIKHKPGYSYLQ